MEHAHELPEFLHFFEELIEEYNVLRGFIFGFIHTLIPLIGFYTGWSINRLLKIISNGAIAGIVGIVLAHIIADLIAALADPNLKSAAYGSFFICHYAAQLRARGCTAKFYVFTARFIFIDGFVFLVWDYFEGGGWG